MRDLLTGLKRAENYFLEMARGSQEGEDYALAEVCHHAINHIEELQAQIDAVKGLPEWTKEGRLILYSLADIREALESGEGSKPDPTPPCQHIWRNVMGKDWLKCIECGVVRVQ